MSERYIIMIRIGQKNIKLEFIIYPNKRRSYGVRNIEFLIGDLKAEKLNCLYCELLNTFGLTIYLRDGE